MLAKSVVAVFMNVAKINRSRAFARTATASCTAERDARALGNLSSVVLKS